MIPVCEAHKRVKPAILVCGVSVVQVGQRGEQCVELLIADVYRSLVECTLTFQVWDALLSLLCCAVPAGFACIGKSGPAH